MEHLVTEGILKQHNGMVSEYLEYRLLNNVPNGERKADHPEFELKSTRYDAQITLADLSDDYLKESFRDTHIYQKCKSMVYIPQNAINGQKVFCGFYHITSRAWESVMDVLEKDWKDIREYIVEHGIENLKKAASSNFVKTTTYIQLFRCKDRISTKTGRLRKPALRIKIRRSLMSYLLDFEINNQNND